MDCVSASINKMGDAFAAFAAASHEPPKAENRKFIETEEGSDESNDDDYNDEADVKSLLNASCREGWKCFQKGRWPRQFSVTFVDDIELSIDDDDDVGADEVLEKLAAITNKAFSKQLSFENVKNKKSTNERPKNCDKVFVLRVNKEIWKQMQRQPLTKKQNLRLMNVQSVVTKAAFAVLRVADGLLKNTNHENNFET